MQTTIELPVCPGFALTEIRTGDKAAFLQHLNDRDLHDRTLRIPYPYTEADADVFLKIVAEVTNGYGEPVQFAVRRADGFLIGGLGFEDLRKGHRAEIGYWMAAPFRRQGIMGAAVQAACQHAFTRWDLVRITAHVFAFNEPSSRLLEKCGFTCEGFLRKHYLKEGHFLDCRLFARVR